MSYRILILLYRTHITDTLKYGVSFYFMNLFQRELIGISLFTDAMKNKVNLDHTIVDHICIKVRKDKRETYG